MNEMRLRSRDARQNVTVKWQADNTSGSTANHLMGNFSEMHDVVTPGFESVQQRGGLVFNPLRHYIQSWEGFTYGPKKAHKTSPQFWFDYKDYWSQHHVGYCPKIITPDVTDLMVEAATRARANIMSPEVDGYVILGELGQTLRMIANPMRSAKRLADAFYKRRVYQERLLRRELKKAGLPGSVSLAEKDLKSLAEVGGSVGEISSALADLYLQARYGLRPLIGDISDVANALLDDRYGDRRTARGFETYREERTVAASQDKANQIRHFYTDTEVCSVEVRSGYLYDWKIEVIAGAFGMDLRNLPRAAWELIPMSFVADWFLNIQDLISAATPKGGTRILGDWTTVKTTNVCSRTFTGAEVYNQPDWQIVRQPTGTCAYTHISKVRHVGAGNRFVGLTFRNRSIRSLLRGADLRNLDLAALIYQRLR